MFKYQRSQVVIGHLLEETSFPKKNTPSPINPLTPASDQDRISLYYFYTTSFRQVMRMKRNVNCGITN